MFTVTIRTPVTVGVSQREAAARSRDRAAACSELPGEQLVQPLVALLDAGLHAAGHERVAALEGVDQRRRDQSGAAVTEVLEHDLLQRDAVGHALEAERLDDQ